MRWRRVRLDFQKPSAKTRIVRGRSRPRCRGVRVEGAGAANGSVEVKMRLLAPTRAQSEVEAQEAAKSALSTNGLAPVPSASKGTRFSKVQAPAPPVGSVEVRTSALLVTATQLSVVVQVKPVIWTEPSG